MSSCWCVTAACAPPQALLPPPAALSIPPLARHVRESAGGIPGDGAAVRFPGRRLRMSCRSGRHDRRRLSPVRMAPEEERATRRSPLDFPIEWDRPKPGRRPDIFPKFSPMKTPLPAPMPTDPEPEEEEEEEEEKEEEVDPDKEEDPENPDESA